ncbi:hypothetical protein [Bacillus nitroreducens]
MNRRKNSPSTVKVISSSKNQSTKRRKGTGGCGCGGNKQSK